MAPQTIEEYLVRELVRDSSSSKNIKEYLQRLDKKQIITLFDNFLDKEDSAEIKIPISILKNRKLSSLGLIVKFLKENLNLTNANIASQLTRSPQVVWTTYNNAKKKYSAKLKFEVSDFDIPISLFRTSKLSVLETIVVFLKSEFNLNFHTIGTLLKRDDRTIWTVYNRALKK